MTSLSGPPPRAYHRGWAEVRKTDQPQNLRSQRLARRQGAYAPPVPRAGIGYGRKVICMKQPVACCNPDGIAGRPRTSEVNGSILPRYVTQLTLFAAGICQVLAKNRVLSGLRLRFAKKIAIRIQRQ
jgi:hypothetical protein